MRIHPNFLELKGKLFLKERENNETSQVDAIVHDRVENGFKPGLSFDFNGHSLYYDIRTK